MKGSATACLGLVVLCISAVLVAQQQTIPQLPAPAAARPNFGSVVPKAADSKLVVPQGFAVDTYADGVQAARLMVFAPNGDLFVSQTGANMVTVFRDSNKDGLPDERSVFAQGPAPRGGRGGGAPRGAGGPPPASTGVMDRPFGLAFHDGYLYVGNTDAIVRYKYTNGDLKAQGEPQKLVDLPAAGNHFTRNVIFSADGRKMYVAVGSADNINESNSNQVRAAIHEYNPDGTGFRLFGTGIRNPVGLALQPGTNAVWTAVNERDGLGDELVPDYASSVKDGGFYGWPYSYIGNHVDTRVANQNAELVAKAIVPDVLIPAHSAALGLTFYTGTQFPQRYRNGLFVALHGSWNRSTTAGVKVIFVPFTNNRPGPIEDFLTGFVVDSNANSKWGRPVGVTVTPDGALLVSDDAANAIYRVRATPAAGARRGN